jgi:RNA polymerase sigma factor (sigma-70 family)
MAGGKTSGLLQHIRRLVGLAGGGDFTDGQLLEQFVAGRDQAAFAALVGRHGPLVMSVCRRLLNQEQDAEDAFQATFLVLARRAAALNRQGSLGNWLYTVTYHTALKCRARRPVHESEVADMPAVQSQGDGEVSKQEMRSLLDEELHRLPLKYRAPLVLCYFQGKSNEEAARELGCPAGSMSWRLAKGRELLRQRLARRGIAISTLVVAQTLGENAARAAVPAALIDSTSKAAVLFAAGKLAMASAVSAPAIALAEGVLQAMFMHKLKIAAALVGMLTLVVGATGIFTYQALADKPGAPANGNGVAAPGAPNQGANAPAGPQVVLKKVDADKRVITVIMPVLPGGDPAAGGEKDFTVSKGAKIVDQAGKEIKDGLKSASIKPPVYVTLTMESKNGSIVITQVKIEKDAPKGNNPK